MMALPAEILDHILSFLQGDPASLRACSTSHPLLSILSEPHLYSRILLKRNNISCARTFTPLNFAVLLSEHPYMANYVRDLEIYVYGNKDHWLEELSNILPMLSSLRRITVNHCASPYPFSWRAQPKCFRLAFWTCIRLPSMREVCLENVTNFPSTSFLDNQYSSLSGLTLRLCRWTNSDSITPEDDLVQASSSYSNGSLPFEYLSFEPGDFDTFTDWSTTGVLLRLRSLKFSSNNYESLKKLLTSCSNTLVNLHLDIGLLGTYFYNPSVATIQKPNVNIPAILSMVPYLEELTIHSPLNSHYCSRRGYGFHSGIPVIAQIFSRKPPSPSSLKHLTLDFDCPTSGLPEFRPPLSVSNVICMPLIGLLSAVSAFSPSIQANLILNGNTFTSLKSLTELPPLLSLLRDSEEIMGFF